MSIIYIHEIGISVDVTSSYGGMSLNLQQIDVYILEIGEIKCEYEKWECREWKRKRSFYIGVFVDVA